MNDTQGIAVVICAAGKSLRMGGIKKEFQKLDNKETVLASSVRAFAGFSSVKIIVISIPENTEAEARKALFPECFEWQRPKIMFVNGGSSRRASVFNALLLLAGFNPCYVLIHDGARPWVSSSLIGKIIDNVKIHEAVIPLLALSDTPKECDSPLSEQGVNFIKNHLRRANTGIAQTPQGFNFPKILHAHEKANETEEEYTDDAEIWGRFCGPVAVIPGEYENKKITFAEDLV
ncbi:MAG: 2-C-methyl-D-erythritol 4-phosphate cytidylyltransferase [Treponema sp.]|nr:2-C-methyl-D-erythritol 4-phosphate cytidylyltransferase [Treponema sp.]